MTEPTNVAAIITAIGDRDRKDRSVSSLTIEGLQEPEAANVEAMLNGLAEGQAEIRERLSRVERMLYNALDIDDEGEPND